MGRRLEVSHGRVQRLMRHTGLQGVHRRRLRGGTRRDQAATPSADLVERNFTPDAPDRLYVADVTQHRTSEGWLYLAVVVDCFSRWTSTEEPRPPATTGPTTAGISSLSSRRSRPTSTR